MQQRVITVVLLIGLCFGLITLVAGMSSWRLPGNEQGYAPKQPIEYSHRLHAGELGIDCMFCHTAADKSRHAGIPSTDVCMKCHKVVTSSFDVLQDEMNKADEEKRKPKQIVSEELRKLYDALALDETLQPKEGATAESIPWVRVHNLPDHVHFDHRAHVAAGVTCQKCHGPVESMQRMEQFESLTMGWCVNCHQESTKTGINGKAVDAKTDCAVCHY
ncbi:MAG TPA: cytochrome c3 family protein [Pirellulaceae bacterium]|nr:cytochrome c3 family protein [Pirellulaceae bacterium]